MVQVLFWRGVDDNRPPEMDLSELISNCNFPGGCTLDEFVERSASYRPVAREAIYGTFSIFLGK
jgi:hypothetical protein